MASGRALVGFLWLAVLVSVTNAWYNESELEEMYESAQELYWNATYHWNMGSGYSDMKGEPGMTICFVEGPELDALVLGGSSNNISSNVTLELQNGGDGVPVKLSLTSQDSFTVALWYSFRPVDFFADVNETMTCDLLKFKSGSSEIKISYDGVHEYNLTYEFSNGAKVMTIDDNQLRENWEFEVNDTAAGDVKERGWQWNHVAMVYNGTQLKAYFNGHLLNSPTVTESSAAPSGAGQLLLNAIQAGKPACAPVGFDEVALWPEALTDWDILALRVHVGRNRSLDKSMPMTTGALTTEQPTTTVLGTTADGSTATTSTDTTTRNTTGGGSTGDATTAKASTVQTTKPTTATTPGDSTSEGQTPTRASSALPPSTSQPSSSASSSSTKPASPNDTLDILDDFVKNWTAHAQDPVKVADILRIVDKVITEQETFTSGMASQVIDVLDMAAQVLPPAVGSHQDIIDAHNNSRTEFVSLASLVIGQLDGQRGVQHEVAVMRQATKLIEAIDKFLENFVDDPTVNDQYITSDLMDVKVSPVDGAPIHMSLNTTVNIPADTFGDATDIKVVVCIIKKGLQGPLRPRGDEQPIETGILYSKQPSWIISGPILGVKTSGQQGSVNLSTPMIYTVCVEKGGKPLCTYKAPSRWSGQGVTTTSYDEQSSCVVCETNHLTNFAVLMAVDGVELEGAHAIALSIISYIGCGLSLFCLTIALILFIVLRELNSTRMGIVKNLCVALFLAQLLFVAGIQTATANEIACKAVAAMLHYFFLCVIAWMLCNGIYLYQKVNSAAKPGGVIDLIYFCILGWGAPAVVVAITAGVNHKVYGSKELCWLSAEGSGIWAFVIPAMLIILFNAFVTFLTMKTFMSVKVFKDKSDKDKFKSGLRAIVVMLPILGLSWIFGLLAFGPAGILFQYLFAIFNSLQGVFLFIFHIFLNEEVKGGLRRRFGKVGASGEENTLFNKIWAFSSSNAERSTQMSSVTQSESLSSKPAYKN